MAIPYELIVEQDLRRGYGPGTVPVTMPGGGTANGSLIGIHTFLASHVHVDDFGAIGDGATDDSAAFQAAHDALAPKGGTVHLGPKTYALANTVRITGQNVSVVGAGGNTYGNQIAGLPATRLKWTGAPGATMLYLGAIAGATNPTLRGAGIAHVFLDGNAVAGTGIEVRSVYNCWVDHVTIISTTAYGLYVGCVVRNNGAGVGLGLAEVRTSLNSRFTNLWINNQAAGDGYGVYLDGDSWTALEVANPAIAPWLSDVATCVFDNLRVFTKTNPSLYIACADSNYISNSQFFKFPYTTAAVVCDLPAGLGLGFDQNNVFFRIACFPGFEQKGGATQNTIYEYDRSQGQVPPTVTTGLLTYCEGFTAAPGIPSHWVTQTIFSAQQVKAVVPASGFPSVSGLLAESTDPTGQSGVDLFDNNTVQQGQLAYRNLSNALLPGVVSLLALQAAVDLVLGANSLENVRLPHQGGLAAKQGALATNAADGYWYLPSCAGVPTAPPTTRTGTVPVIFDTTDNKLYAFLNGAWKAVTLA